MKKKHHELRLNGYLEFYKKTYTHHRLPLYIVSLWNCVILLLQTLMQHFYADDFAEQCVRKDLFTPLNYICAIITLEVCVLFGISTSYIGKLLNYVFFFLFKHELIRTLGSIFFFFVITVN